MNQQIVISSGDINGIGPEIIIKYLHNKELNGVTPIILSDPEVFDYYKDILDLHSSYRVIQDIHKAEPERVNLLKSYDAAKGDINPGTLSKKTGKYAMQAVEKGIELCNKEEADALVTAPISKEAVNLAGYHIPGHTEFLAEHTNTSQFMMMLVNDGFRVGLNSVHIPLQEVRQTITQDAIREKVELMHQSLSADFAIDEPVIAVLGLNPHAGDGGIIGTEEQEFIGPVIWELQQSSYNITGPHPADGFFGNQKYKSYDGILAMYHDQGLIPFKTLSFGNGVNYTAGLPIIRTSPDHGTAFDIAGQGKADSRSFTQA